MLKPTEPSFIWGLELENVRCQKRQRRAFSDTVQMRTPADFKKSGQIGWTGKNSRLQDGREMNLRRPSLKA